MTAAGNRSEALDLVQHWAAAEARNNAVTMTPVPVSGAASVCRGNHPQQWRHSPPGNRLGGR
jgi:hypothetical protein